MTESKNKKNNKTHPEDDSSNKKNKSKILWVILIAILVFAAGTYILNAKMFQTEKTVEFAAIVNNEKIEMSYLNTIYESLNPAVQMQITKFQLLNMSIIPEVLLNQEAEKSGLNISDDEITLEIESYLLSLGINREQLESELKSINSSYEEYYEVMEKRIKINRFVNENFVPEEITETEAIQYYADNEEYFVSDTGEKIDYEVVADSIKTNMWAEKQQAMIIDYINQIRQQSKILVNNVLLE